MKVLLFYMIAISVFGVAITVFDKFAAIKSHRRISEQALLCVAALGGSFAMLVTMMLIKHKTRKVKFMAGIPLIIAIQLFFAFFIVMYLHF